MAGGRSQRHKVLYQGVASNGETEASGVGGGDIGASPAVTSLAPSSIPYGTPQLTVGVVGTGFTEDSVITWNGVDVATTMVDDKLLQTIVDPSVEGVAHSVPVGVHNGNLYSGTKPFSFVAPGADAELDDEDFERS